MEIEGLPEEAEISYDRSEHVEFYRSVCQDYGSSNFINFLVDNFGEEATGQVLEDLGVNLGLSGSHLISIYTKGRH